ncbi:GL11147 [Drosophila persimilis]|uniref:protein Late bloomer isoform X1 n=3 Tax=pseudoobscura subgroup TaxID=32358 RepID=A0A6I8V3Q1_DROPS|nr:protein late bloomer [Drosophila persimilis]XP_002138182.1 protein late bloomer isoform X1 [Drosophila pseudoobscura]XP_015039094.1 protein late bloomer isoform X1 [Drosophila pseudoobscura]XP_026841485.1 protein late bloomer [Drosophila persimilis]EDW31456.1 GL11147 [Drosophila persimilis]
MGCATTSVKITSIILNAILGLLALGSIGWIAYNADTESEEFVIAAYVACSLILVFAMLGIVAAIRESVALTATSAVFLLVLAIPQIVSTCMLLHQYEVQSGQETVEVAWQANNMDALQQKHECCGKSSAQDYVHLNQLIPPSCYADLQQTTDHLFLEGCIEKVQSFYESDKQRFIIVSWVLVAFELLCFVLAVFLAISFRNKQRRLQF